MTEWDHKEQKYKKKLRTLEHEIRTLKENQQVSPHPLSSQITYLSCRAAWLQCAEGG